MNVFLKTHSGHRRVFANNCPGVQRTAGDIAVEDSDQGCWILSLTNVQITWYDTERGSYLEYAKHIELRPQYGGRR